MALLLNKQDLVAEIIPRPEHNLSRDDVSKSALKVLYRLHKGGYQAYLVGGSVRDILLGQHPKDFDVVTDASPEQIKKLFKNSLIIGRRFRLVHVRYGHDIIEVATFRGENTSEGDRKHTDTGMIVRDNVYGDMKDDVLRRDFTVNALYYNIADFTVVDYVTGVDDIRSKTLRVLGEPTQRYREDPVRMLRAIRLAAKLGFSIEKKSAAGIYELRELLEQVAPSRMFDEMVKMSMCGKAKAVYDLLFEYHVFELIFPQPFAALERAESDVSRQTINIALEESDARIQSGKTINPAFLIAVIFWPVLQQLIEKYRADGEKLYPAINMAQTDVLKNLAPLIVPKRLQMIIKDMWILQYHMTQTRRNRIVRCLYHPRFRAAYDFLLIRQRAGEDLSSLCDFWTKLQEANHEDQDQLIAEHQNQSGLSGPSGKQRRRRRRRKRT